MNTTMITDAVVDGLKQGSTDVAAKKLLEGVKKAAGDNYPAILSTPVGQVLEPLIIPAVVSLVAQLATDILLKKNFNKGHAAYNGTAADRWAFVVAKPTDYPGPVKIMKVAEVANLALTHAVADLSSEQLSRLLDLVTEFAGDLVADLPTDLVTDKE
jgi:hypothetical protein